MKVLDQKKEWLSVSKQTNKMKLHATFKRLTLDAKTHRLKMKRQKKVSCANGDPKRAEVAILTSGKIHFKSKKKKKEKSDKRQKKKTLYNDKRIK